MKINISKKTGQRMIALAAMAGTFQVSHALATDFLFTGSKSYVWNPTTGNNWFNLSTNKAVATYPGNSTNQGANAVIADSTYDYSTADALLGSTTIASLSGQTIGITPVNTTLIFDTISFGFADSGEGVFMLASNVTIGSANTTIDLATNGGGLFRLTGANDGTTGGQHTGLPYSATSGTQTINSNLVLFNASSQTWALGGTGGVVLNGTLTTTSTQSVIKSKTAQLEFGAGVNNAATFLGGFQAQGGTTLLDNNNSLGPVSVNGVTTTVQASGVPSATSTSLLINTGVTYAYNTVVVTPKAGYQVATLGAKAGVTGTSWTGNIQVNDGVTLTSPGAGQSIKFSGIISDGTGGIDLNNSAYSFVNSNLIDSSAGTVILSGSNSYTGSTNVSGGTLQAGAANTAFGHNSAIILGNVPGTALNLANFSQTVGSITGGGTTGGNINLGSGNLTVGADNTSPGAFAGVISGTGGLNKVGTGIAAFTGSNTYSGTTSISGGTVNLGVAETAGISGPLGSSIADGSIVLGGGVLQYSAANQNDYSGRFSTAANQQYNIETNGQTVTWATGLTSSNGTLTKAGTGTLNLTGASTYSGSTTVNNGTLNIGGATGSLNASTALVLGGGSFVYSNTGGTTQAVNGVAINAGLSSISNTVSGDTLNLGALNNQPGAAIDFTNLTGTITTTTPNSGGILGGWATSNGGTSWAVATGSGPIYTISSFNSYTQTSVALADPANYAGQFIDVDSAQTPTGAVTVNSLRFNTAAAETLTLTGTNVVTSGGILITPNVGANQSVITGGTLEVSGGALYINQNNNAPGGTFNISSVIADNGSPTALIKNGAGTLVLSGSNIYSGITYVNSGVLSAGVATNAFGNASAVVISNSATLDLSGGFNETVGSLASLSSGAGSVTLGSSTLSVGSDNTNTNFSGVISGSGGVTKVGSGITTFSGSNTYTGATTLSGGNVNLASTETPGTSGPLGNQARTAAGSIVFAGGTLQYSSVNTFDYSGRFSSAANQPISVDTNGQNVTWASPLSSTGGTLTKIGAGSLTLSGLNQYTGTTIVSGGILSAGVVSSATGGAFGLNSAVVLANTAGATLNLNSFATTIGSLAGGGPLGGNVTLSSSKLTVGTDNTNTTYAGVISGSGGVQKSGNGTLTLSGANTYTGNINLSGGVVSLASVETPGVSGPLGEGTIVPAGGTLQYTSSNTFDYSPRFAIANFEQYGVDTNGQNIVWTAGLNSPGGTLTKTGNGTLTITTAGKYSGATTVNGGTLTAAVQSAGTAGAFGFLTNVTLNNASGVTLNLNGFNNAIGSLTGGGPLGGNVTLGSATLTVGGSGISPPAYGGVISGTGGLTKVGPETLELQVSNSYSGPTNVSAGTLVVDSTAALNNATALTVNGAANFSNATQAIASLNGSGTVNLNGTTLTVSGGGSFSGIVGNGASPGSLVIGSGSTLNIASTGAINTLLVAAGNVVFANNSGGSSYLVRALPSLNLSGGTVNLAAGSQTTRQLFSIGSAGLSGSGLIDLGNNDLVLQAGGAAGLSQVVSLLQQGFANGTWQGSGGIVSSSAASNASHLTTLAAIADPANITSFDGQTVGSTDVLVKYTYYGDTDLSGVVDGTDYSRIDNGFIQNLTGWYNGDFNYDGVVNGSDYTLIDNAFNTQGAALSAELATPTAEIAGKVSAVPEPGSLVLLGIGAAGLLGRRRRRSGSPLFVFTK